MAFRGVYRFIAQERVHFGKPALETVLEEVDQRSAKHVLIVASKTLSRKTDVVSSIAGALGLRHAGTFDRTVEHVPRGSVLDLMSDIRSTKPDLIVTVGGGTPIDTVKVSLLGLAQGVSTAEEFDQFHIRVKNGGVLDVPAIDPPPVRQIIVPTTLSGSEFTNFGAAVDHKTGTKHLYTAREICGDAVILDPAITLYTPEWLWLSTGMRAIDHAVESICSKAPQPFSDATCLRGIEMLARSLRRNRSHPDDLEARSESQIGAWLATTGIGRVPFGASHGIGHPLGSVSDVPHGYSTCVLLPSVLRYNQSINGNRQEFVARAMGRAGVDAADAVAELISDLGLPARLQDVNVKRSQLDTIATGSVGNVFVSQNPRPIKEPSQVREILEMAW